MEQTEDCGTVARVLDDLRQCAVRAEQLLRQRPQQEQAQIACAPGCGSCCVVNVSTLLPEGIAISRYLQRFSSELQHQLEQRLDTLWQRIRGLDDTERLAVQTECAFLDEQGRCLIYPVRPLLCRSVTSTAAQACRDALSSSLLDEEMPVLMYQYQQELYESLFVELAEHLEKCGIDGRSFQLSGLVRYLLKNPATETGLLSGRRLVWQELY